MSILSSSQLVGGALALSLLLIPGASAQEPSPPLTNCKAISEAYQNEPGARVARESSPEGSRQTVYQRDGRTRTTRCDKEGRMLEDQQTDLINAPDGRQLIVPGRTARALGGGRMLTFTPDGQPQPASQPRFSPSSRPRAVKGVFKPVSARKAKPMRGFFSSAGSAPAPRWRALSGGRDGCYYGNYTLLAGKAAYWANRSPVFTVHTNLGGQAAPFAAWKRGLDAWNLNSTDCSGAPSIRMGILVSSSQTSSQTTLNNAVSRRSDGVSLGGFGNSKTMCNSNSAIACTMDWWQYTPQAVRLTESDQLYLPQGSSFNYYGSSQTGVINWSYSTGTPTASQTDFQSMVTHETGHSLGLSHVPDYTDQSMMPYVNGGTTYLRTLGWGDLSGLYYQNVTMYNR